MSQTSLRRWLRVALACAALCFACEKKGVAQPANDLDLKVAVAWRLSHVRGGGTDGKPTSEDVVTSSGEVSTATREGPRVAREQRCSFAPTVVAELDAVVRGSSFATLKQQVSPAVAGDCKDCGASTMKLCGVPRLGPEVCAQVSISPGASGRVGEVAPSPLEAQVQQERVLRAMGAVLARPDVRACLDKRDEPR